MANVKYCFLLILVIGYLQGVSQLRGKRMLVPNFGAPKIPVQPTGKSSNTARLPFSKSNRNPLQKDAAAGRTTTGGYTDKYGNVLGGSGKPRVYTARYPNEKTAKESAKQRGYKSAVKHASPTKGNPHFHPADKKGNKMPGSKHYEYSRRKKVNTINKNNPLLKN